MTKKPSAKSATPKRGRPPKELSLTLDKRVQLLIRSEDLAAIDRAVALTAGMSRNQFIIQAAIAHAAKLMLRKGLT